MDPLIDAHMEEEPSSTSILTRQAVMAALELPLETVSKRSHFSLEALEKKSDITRAFLGAKSITVTGQCLPCFAEIPEL